MTTQMRRLGVQISPAGLGLRKLEVGKLLFWKLPERGLKQPVSHQ